MHSRFNPFLQYAMNEAGLRAVPETIQELRINEFSLRGFDTTSATISIIAIISNSTFA